MKIAPRWLRPVASESATLVALLAGILFYAWFRHSDFAPGEIIALVALCRCFLLGIDVRGLSARTCSRDELIQILRCEYAYWRDAEPPRFDDSTPENDRRVDDHHAMQMGGMGAAANCIAAAMGHPAPWHAPAPQKVERPGSER